MTSPTLLKLAERAANSVAPAPRNPDSITPLQAFSRLKAPEAIYVNYYQIISRFASVGLAWETSLHRDEKDAREMAEDDPGPYLCTAKLTIGGEVQWLDLSPMSGE